jgi:hypothetical protein
MTVRCVNCLHLWNHTAEHKSIVFDEGELRDNPEAAAEMMASLMQPMEGVLTNGDVVVLPENRLPILKVHDSVWERMQEVRTPPSAVPGLC